MSIEIQVQENRRKFRVDHFDIVISEYISRLNENKVILNPPYQRNFRWDIKTQSALIESILIGIPLPPIFAFSNVNYHWEIIDGLQRTTTLKNFINSRPDDENIPKFESCEILTDLNGKAFFELPEGMQNAVKNFRIRIELVEDNADAYSQYLLFSRLNSNGEQLSNQELRNFLVYKLNPQFYAMLSQLKQHPSFKSAVSLKSKRIDKQEDVEYILKFFLSRKFGDYNKIPKYADIDTLITTEIQNYLREHDNEFLSNEYAIFIQTYDFIFTLLGENSFRYFHKNINSIVNTSIIATGISFVIEDIKNSNSEDILSLLSDFFNSEDYKKLTAQGYSPTKRFFELSMYACNFFKRRIK